MPYSDPEQQKQYQREWLSRRRSAWIASQGGRCVECGSTDRIEIDHIDPSEKAFNPTVVWSLKKTARDAELAKCQLLCRDCHLAKTFAPKPIVHGTGLGYTKHRCRCDLCRGWNCARQRRQRDARYQAAAPTRHAA